MAPVFYFSACQIHFTSKYDGKSVAGLVGSSVNFTWSFSGDVDLVDWGLKKDGVNVIKNNGKLVSLEKIGPVSVTVPSAYSGRVSGSGDVSSGQVTFTPSLITKNDKGPTDTFNNGKFDFVYLAVKVAYLLAYSNDTIVLTSVQSTYTATGASVFCSEIDQTCLLRK